MGGITRIQAVDCGKERPLGGIEQKLAVVHGSWADVAGSHSTLSGVMHAHNNMHCQLCWCENMAATNSISGKRYDKQITVHV